MHYFIRGYFEGDGHINKGRLYRVTFTSASLNFLKQLSHYIYTKLGIESVLDKYEGNYWKLRLNQKSAVKLLKWMYSGEIFVKSQRYIDYQMGIELFNIPIKKRPRNFLGLDVFLIKTLREKERYTLRQISNVFDCSPETIRQRLKDLQ